MRSHGFTIVELNYSHRDSFDLGDNHHTFYDRRIFWVCQRAEPRGPG